MKKKIYITLLLTLFIKGYSQGPNNNINTSINIFPSSPDSYNLGTYGNVNIGEYTGTMMQDIPLYEYSIGDIKVPVSLKYSSNGIKVDEYTSLPGLGWTMSANGIISKIVRDKEDPLNGALWQKDETEDQATGYRALQLNFYEYTSMMENFDTEKDLYRVNIPGVFSTSFVRDGADTWIQEKKSDFKIKKIPEGFLIISPQGIKYYFTVTESSESRVQGVGWVPSEVSFESAYFLTRIEDTKNNIVYFEYGPDPLRYTANNNNTYNFFDTMMSINCSSDQGIPFASINGMKKTSTIVSYDSHRLKKIRNNINQNVLEFNYAPLGENTRENRSGYLHEIKNLQENGNGNPTIIDTYKMEYLLTSNNRVFLTKVYSETNTKQYKFEYINPELLPRRLSNAQDFWGYFNGATQNSHLIGKVDHYYLDFINFSFANREIDTNLSQSGLLSKITYPTKGYSKIFYEPHTKWGTKITPAPTKFDYMTVLTDDITDSNTTTKKIYSGKSQMIKFSGGAKFNQDCSAMTHQVRVYIKVKNLSTGQFEKLSTLSSLGYINEVSPYYYPGGSNEYYLDAKASVEYQVSISVSRPCFGGGVSFRYIDAPDSVVDTNLSIGGNRVEKIEHYDNVSSSPKVEKWYYSHKNQLHKSSGVSSFMPVLWKYTQGVHYCPPTELNPMFYKYTPYKYVSIFSNSLIPLFGNESQNVGYEYVTKSYGGLNFEKGGTFTEYVAGSDPIASNIFGEGIYRGGNYSNSKWNKGLVKKTEDLILKNGVLSPVKEVINEYFYNTSKKEEFLNFTGIKYGDTQMISKKTYKCTASDIVKNNTGFNPCFGKPLDYGIYYFPPIDLRMFGEVLQYKFFSHDYYLSKVTTNENFDNGVARTTVEYLYNNPLHYQQTSQKVTFPDLKVNETSYGYAHEKGNEFMVGKNMVGIPLETVTTQSIANNQKTLSKFETLYPVNQAEADMKTSGLTLPYKVNSKDLLDVVSTEITYDKYDDKGNLQQYTTKDGISTVIIWGYNNTYPIAKIENARYADVSQSLISTLVNASNLDASAGRNNDETDLLNALNTFRNGLSNNKVTTYTYDLLIGVRSITPPSGIRELYLYDSANRLEKVVDVDGKVLKEMKYNYKN